MGITDAQLQRFPNFNYEKMTYKRMPHPSPENAVAKVGEVPSATESGDCGVFMLMYMEFLTANLGLEKVTSDEMEFFRQKMEVRDYPFQKEVNTDLLYYSKTKFEIEVIVQLLRRTSPANRTSPIPKHRAKEDAKEKHNACDNKTIQGSSCILIQLLQFILFLKSGTKQVYCWKQNRSQIKISDISTILFGLLLAMELIDKEAKEVRFFNLILFSIILILGFERGNQSIYMLPYCLLLKEF
ncbi:uncharacterized protein LOC124928929 [Impatiens glandulifera]|uniref:uncharacterized protein LOC124928929 n=1 Tax=Impatiens glandulifera TaxID=253017 RepID=UPI001FB1A1CE|nr:uncharacterized protein LOC124928929 [Impatiens glandulifera]